MNLYILEPRDDLSHSDNPWRPWFDKVFAMVVRAESESQARAIAHENAGDENRGEFLGKKVSKTKRPWLDENYTTCNVLTSDGDIGLIIADERDA